MSSFVLASKYPDGSPMYYRFWTQIGPCCTRKLDEAERFESALDAMNSPAFGFSLTFFEPLDISNVVSVSDKPNG